MAKQQKHLETPAPQGGKECDPIPSPPQLEAPAATPQAPSEAMVEPQPWFEVTCGDLMKRDIQAPNEQTAVWLYKQQMRITQGNPVAKRVT